MKRNIPSVSIHTAHPAHPRPWLRFCLPPLALFLAGNAWAARYQDIEVSNDPNVCKTDLPTGPGGSLEPVKLAAKLNTPANSLTCLGFSSGCDIATVGVGGGGSVYWTFANDINPAPASNCSGAAPNLTCAGINLTLPAATDVLAPATAKALLSNVNALNETGRSNFYLTVAKEDGTAECRRHYRFSVTSDGGGWGDPHITTVDGVDYDFQSAGEFVALRDGGIEIQTRQAPVATTSIPGANPYTGLASCVSVYSAVAARVGKYRVSYQQNSKDEKVMELRVDGQLVTLGADGINLESKPIVGRPPLDVATSNPGSVHPQPVVTRPPVGVLRPNIGGRIVKAATGEGIEIHYTDGTKVVVTQSWWSAQQMWYLNVDAYETTATEGVMGRIAKGSWLPALADGSALGPKPATVHDRYTDLYEKFADSWRVTDATSLFDYEPGTSTKTFTLADWPRESPTTCAIGGQQALKPVSVSVANRHCSAIVDKKAKANCVFDVTATGHTGFAKTYLIQQKLRGVSPIGTKPIDRLTRTGERVSLIVSKSRSNPASLAQFIVDGRNFGRPVRFDANGQAALSTSSLPAGKHRIAAKYIRASLVTPTLPGTGPAIDQPVVPAQPITH